MITFFTIPKPFEGQIGLIQQRALASWRRVHPDAQVLVLGEAVDSSDVESLAQVARNEHGTPLLDDAFRLAERHARHDVLCFVNADILLPPSLAEATARVATAHERFLIVGECRNVRLAGAAEEIPWAARGRRRGADAVDYFVYTRGLYDDVPPFAIGRTVFDNWLVWRARAAGAAVVDATSAVRALHQDHSYAHVGSLGDVRVSPEAVENRRLAGGGRERLYSRYDATHRLIGPRLVPNPLGWRHSGETARRAWAKLAYSTGLRRG